MSNRRNTKSGKPSRLDRIESKCDRILSELASIRRQLYLTVETIVRAFKAMGIPDAFSFGGVSLSLC